MSGPAASEPEHSTGWIRSCVVAHRSPIVSAGLLAVFGSLPDVDLLQLPDPDAPGQPWPDMRPSIVFSDHASCVAAAGPGRSASRLAHRWVCVTAKGKDGEIREALEAGVMGYLLEDGPIDEFLDCLRKVQAGSRFVCAEASRQLAESAHLEALTPREVAVLRLVIDGRDNLSIGAELGIALGTVKAHVRAILAKLGARSRTQAATLAAARGITKASRTD